jgi:hypothetical protein
MDVHTRNRIDQCGAQMDLIGARHQLDKKVHFPRRQGHDLSAHAGQVACGADSLAWCHRAAKSPLYVPPIHGVKTAWADNHPHRAAHFKPVHFRQANIKHHQIRFDPHHRRQPFAPVARLLGLKTRLGQRNAHHVADVGIIINDQDCLAHGAGSFWETLATITALGNGRVA